MSDTSANNKRIAKNTLMLYIRMFFIMLISLFTSRVVLNTLGVENYGINNAVGGMVAMFSLLSGSLSNAISRFFTFELGRGDFSRLRSVFSTSVNIQIIMAVAIFIIAEVVGVWFLNSKMNIPPDRLSAANWVLHCSVLSFAVNLISIPYNACIIAHERMSVFAYISIVEVVLKLAIVYMLWISPFDKLIVYSILLLSVSVIIRIIYGAYCSRNFEECKYRIMLDKGLFREMAGFAGWNFFGNTAYMLNTQGVNMLINIFFGVALNAARGIAVQVEAAVNQFVNNFMTALNPQITKSYAAGDYGYMVKLICRGSKFSFFIMFLFIVPFELEAEMILKLWLGAVPEYAATFLRLVLLASLANIIGNPLYVAILATGKIKRYQLMVASYGCLVFPLSWIAYKIGLPAYSTYIIYAFIYFTLNGIRLIEIKRLMNFPVMQYVNSVLWRMLLVGGASFFLPLLLHYMIKESIYRVFVVCICGVLWTALCSYIFGLDKNEQNFILQKVFAMKSKFVR